MESKDLIVLGSGPGGYVAAIRASQLGRDVTIIEKAELGGVCLNWGCIPSKALLKSAHFYHQLKHCSEFGFSVENTKLDFPAVVDRSREVAKRMEGGVKYLMKKNKIEVINGYGRLVGGNKLSVALKDGGEAVYSYKDIIIATGARPKELPNLITDGKVVHTSKTILSHKVLPQKLLVIGAGAIGIEFAYFFNAFGTKVTVVELLPQILPVEDGEISAALSRILKREGIEIHTGVELSDFRQSGKTVSVEISSKKGKEKWSGDACLVAIGVAPNSEDIGLDKAGIQTDERGFIQTDSFLKTSAPHHYAIGDVSGPPLLAHKASHEGIVAAEAACGKAHHPMRYDNIPSCTYCHPQVASIGITEEKAKEKGVRYTVAKIPFTAIGKAVAIGEPDGMVKVLTDPETFEVLGVHILHSEATELISEAAIIRSHEGIAQSVLDTIHPHPTLSESIMEAMALALGRPINF